MFQKMTPLNHADHRELRFAASQPYQFAAGQMLVPLVASELPMAAREYVIVFSQGENSLPQALVGVERGRNAYVNETGHWLARYVPAHVRRYPFQLASLPPASGQSEAEQRFSVMIDADAPHLGQGERLFTDEGKATPVLENVQKVLGALQKDFERTRYLVNQLDEAKLLTANGLKVTPRSGKPVQIDGLRLIDLKAFAALDGDALSKLARSGALAVIYAHIFSLTNLKDGQLTRDQKSADVQLRAAGISLADDGNISFT